jgi:aspartate aminotransferase
MSSGEQLHLSRRALELPRSGIREVMELAAGRPDVIHLEVGEPDFATPPHIVAAAAAAARAGSTK